MNLTAEQTRTLITRLSGDRRRHLLTLLASRHAISAAGFDEFERRGTPMHDDAMSFAAAFLTGEVVQNSAGDWIVRPLRSAPPALLGIRPPAVPRSETVHVAGEVVRQSSIIRPAKRGSELPEISELRAGAIREAEAADEKRRKVDAARDRAGFGKRIAQNIPLMSFGKHMGNG